MPQITDSLVRALKPPPAGKQTKVYDSKVTGFGVRVTASGHKAFIVNYTCKGRERRITIGAHPTWSVAAAREQAQKHKRDADLGVDPKLAREQNRSRPMVRDLWNRYNSDVLPNKRPRTAKDERSMWERLILPEIGNVFVDELTPEAVDALHRKISKCTPVQANRCIASLRHAFNKAIRWKQVDRSPVHGVNRNPEIPRERFLTDVEKTKFLQALANRPTTSSTLAIQFIMFTGCRKSEALGARWEQFDLDNAVWTKPSSHTKQKRTHRVPLAQAAIEILRKAKRENGTKYVFQGRNGKHLVDPKRMFQAVCDKAGISDFRIHDLRHSYASFLAADGVDLGTIGKLLGHTQYATTQRYAHLADETLRKAAETVSARLQN